MRIDLYHGTDYNSAVCICKSDFIVKPSDDHWLGNGIYFYPDEELARWWTTNPSKKYGERIKKPAIVKISAVADNQTVLDLRKLKHFNLLVEWELEYRSLIGKYSEQANIQWKKYRCGLFDYIFEEKNINVIIGCFHIPSQPYINMDMRGLLKKIRIGYTEVQVCIKEKSQKEIIVTKELYSI